MKEQSVKSNLLFQGLYQFLILGVPLISSPYLTRTLGAEQLGIYTYTNSIAYYFVILATLGISRHGQRVIAAASHDKIRLRKTFWSLYLVHAFFSILALLCYVVFILFITIGNEIVFAIQGLYVLSALFDITWLFYGLENFRSVVIKNTVVKLLELICVFVFVHKPNDLYMYTFIMAGSILIGQFIMIPQMFKLIKPIRVKWGDCKQHIKPLLVLSISVIAVSLYTVFDKTLLGLMLDMSSVSYYEYANKIISVPKTLLGVITTVLFPKVCKLVENENDDTLKKFFDTSFFFTALLGVGFTFIVIGVSRTFAPLYFGTSFAMTGQVMIAMAPVIIIVSLGDLIRTQLMISKHKDGQFILCVVINSIVNIVLSVSLIQIIGIYGAVVGSVMAELCGLMLETWFCRKEINIKNTYLEVLPFLVGGVVALIPMMFIEKSTGISFVSFLAQGVIGCLVYCALCVIYMIKFRRKYFNLAIKSIKKG